MIAEVVFHLPIERGFHYLIPPSLRQSLQPGMRVMAPFGPRERMGFVVQCVPTSPIRSVKPLRCLVDQVPMVTGERWALASWLSEYYGCSLGEALFAMVPSSLRLHASEERAPSAGESRPARVADGTAAAVPVALALSAHQQRALHAIEAALASPSPRPLLLHGVTASGKTELYLQAADRALAQGRSAIYLIPEIALTPQTIDRFQARFGADMAVWHSRLTARQRAMEWSRLAQGTCRIVVGARSAVFAPVQRLGLIILDEEHESTYKQESTPRYHARDVAFARARYAGAAVLLGSATPSIESYYAATRRRSMLLALPERIEGRPLPRVDIIDMRQELGRRYMTGPLSPVLQRALQRTLEQGEQAMLLLNRRGFARVIQCKTCGHVRRCERCAVPLIYHAKRQQLLCHYCNFQEPPAECCDQCRKGYLRFRGSGTERVESELHRIFPASSIARMDRDVTKHRDRYREIYEAMKTEQVGLLVGTQMIAKGLDFPSVTLVGIVSADTSLNLPDFRAGERTFDLLTQMAGRAGRGTRPGSVLIQTFCPDHYAIQAAKHHDYHRFYREEIGMRRRLALPPFMHLVELTIQGSSRQRTTELADRLADALRRAIAASIPQQVGEEAISARQRGNLITLLGPAPHRIPRLRRLYRMHLLLKSRAVEPMVGLLRQVLQAGRRFDGVPITVDVDPL